MKPEIEKILRKYLTPGESSHPTNSEKVPWGYAMTAAAEEIDQLSNPRKVMPIGDAASFIAMVFIMSLMGVGTIFFFLGYYVHIFWLQIIFNVIALIVDGICMWFCLQLIKALVKSSKR